MRNSLGVPVKQGLKVLVALFLMIILVALVSRFGEGRSYNIERMGLAYLPGDSVSKNGYACGYVRFWGRCLTIWHSPAPITRCSLLSPSSQPKAGSHLSQDTSLCFAV